MKETEFSAEVWKSRALYEQSRREHIEKQLAKLAFASAVKPPRHLKGWRRFWTVRVMFILMNAPAIVYLQVAKPAWLVPYLVWMSWATWLSSELPTGGSYE